MNGSRFRPFVRGAAALASAAAAQTACGQASFPAVFVANNGNLEGSVSSFVINPDSSLTSVDRIVLGTRPNTTVPCAGCNCEAISVSPNGRFLAIGHATGSTTGERVTILEVASDGSLSQLTTAVTTDDPLDVVWVTDTILAVLRTNAGGQNEVITFELDPMVPSLVERDRENVPGFTATVIVHPNRQFIFASESSTRTVSSFAVDSSGTLALIESQSGGATYPLGIGISADGKLIYGGGGISNGSDKIVGFFVNSATGMLDLMDAAPYTSPGASPKQVIVEESVAYAYAAHGTDATIRAFSVDDETGILTSTGFSFDVGIQGSLGTIASMGDLLFATDRDTIIDGQRGVYSFTINPDGSLTQNGALIDNGGIGPDDVDTWNPPPAICEGDADGNNQVDVNDISYIVFRLGLAAPNDEGADVDGSGAVDVNDISYTVFRLGNVCNN